MNPCYELWQERGLCGTEDPHCKKQPKTTSVALAPMFNNAQKTFEIIFIN